MDIPTIPPGRHHSIAVETATPGIVVRQVETKRDRDQFIQLAWSLYQDDPNWVPPLIAEMRTRLTPGKNPYFEHAEAALFVAERDGKIVGRISAQVCQLAQQHQGPGTGHFGFFEAENSQPTADALFSAAEQWLLQRDMKTMVGPFNLSINEEAGMLVAGFHSPPYIFMGHHLPYYDSLVAGAGLQKQIDLLAYELDIVKAHSPRFDRLLRATARGTNITMRTVDKKRLHTELAMVLDVFNEAWSDNWGHIPMTDAEVNELAMLLRRVFDTDAVILAEIDGELAGFIVAIPNLNELTADLDGKLFPLNWLRLLYRLKFGSCRSVRVPLMGIRKQYQSTRTGAALALSLIERCRQSNVKKGVRFSELSWILESNTAMRGILDAMESPITKTYRMYSKPLSPDHG
ncbi:hypothetical protein NHH03_22200 [Stieleria sp. TO1_6]|uniref:hypothetical protein n=1 Tax=Stieleria tagensis TaxID=2956795 RepID=UPI00209AFC7A|nr:hypothetical protein [Stieleria tagensis]MCO8124468.1 hypothetical protein [Stieleria tagensis]